MRRSLTVLLLACAALLGAVAPAQAHNVLIGSDPEDGASIAAGPERITLTFDQPARQGFALITLTGPDGTRWEEGKTAVDGAKVSVGVRPLGPAGEYVVGYRILSSDGHPVSGKVAFTLTAAGPGSAQPAAAASASAVPAASGAPAQDPARDPVENPGLSAQAAEAAQNGGAGMAVVWIAAALVLLGGATVVAMRRTRERTEAP
ncbi:copper resistance protein CopC [Planomonospora sp. ID91781]|uniref:copper resistance CopC family protein n=1 Tax=Planomonospora sp. ID91781 TaxID=2738135 RepID=UPI0018C3D54A|nr:copper resistance CopC family protein [Planomonospora sp. ID91781]MBG0824528.1 copper resistance protein CopC [Planomonospora sp. ID91781]